MCCVEHEVGLKGIHIINRLNSYYTKLHLLRSYGKIMVKLGFFFYCSIFYFSFGYYLTLF